MTRVVHCKKDKYDVYCGRPSKWANPFRIGPDGDRVEVIRKYKKYIITRIDLLNCIKRGELRNKVLGCWCSPLACHCDILVKIDKFFESLSSQK